MFGVGHEDCEKEAESAIEPGVQRIKTASPLETALAFQDSTCVFVSFFRISKPIFR